MDDSVTEAPNMTPRSLDSLGLTDLRRGSGSPQITGLAVDSRDVRPGVLFAALPGVNAHGARFASDALAAGAVAILTDEDGYAHATPDDGAVWLVAQDARAALSGVAARWYGAQPETMVAVTGTNGKTSVASFTRQLWSAMGLRAVNFGTTGVEGAVSAPLSHTTPEPVTLHRLLADLAGRGVTHGAMEASSHGLAQRRLDGVRLRAAAFTHLSRDHLDYHATVADYEAAKGLLFDRVLPEGATAVINLDTDAGERMIARATGAGRKVLTVGRTSTADLRLCGTTFEASGQRVTFTYAGAEHTASLRLIGSFQAENALLAAGLALACGGAAPDVFAALEVLESVAGRMQLAAHATSGGAIYVDYSHTPDSIATALRALRPHVEGKLICILGAGGDRDPGKRSLMGEAATQAADVVIVTDDNPRSEDPAAIRAAVMAGAPGAREIGDRAQAIAAGVAMLGPHDTLLIAGKGHETGQIVGDKTLPFNDVEVARRSAVTAE